MTSWHHHRGCRGVPLDIWFNPYSSVFFHVSFNKQYYECHCYLIFIKLIKESNQRYGLDQLKFHQGPMLLTNTLVVEMAFFSLSPSLPPSLAGVTGNGC